MLFDRMAYSYGKYTKFRACYSLHIVRQVAPRHEV